MDVAGSGIVGIVSGLLVCFGVWLLDYVLHIDDPVGAVAVHMMNGIWGTIAVGLFATTTAPANDTMNGLFYGGGFDLLGKQLLGFASVAAWAAVTMTIVFFVIKKTLGLRASEQEEILGMDATEHGLVSSYADFMPAMSEAAIAGYVKGGAKSDEKAPAAVSAAEAVPVENNIPNDVKAPKMTKIAVVFNQEKLHHFIHAMERIGITGVTVTNVMGCGIQKSNSYYRGAKMSATLHPKIKAEIVVCKVPVDTVVKTAREVLYTGQVGDGKIFIYPVEKVIKVRTGSVNYDALQSEEMPEKA